jgi:hypothetical protein
MASIATMKVTPINGAAEQEEGNNEGTRVVLGLGDIAPPEPEQVNEEEDKAAHVKFMLRQVAINKQFELIQNMFTYDYIKSTTHWFIETASCKVSISVSPTLTLKRFPPCCLISILVRLKHSVRRHHPLDDPLRPVR